MQEPLKLPNGCIDTSFMFIDEKFPECTNFDEFNMCGVVCADYMFAYCDLRNVDHFGDLFDTTSLKSAVGMFINVSFGEGFYFGSNFSLMHLENAKKMFYASNIRKGINFGSKFNTSSLVNADSMFSNVYCYGDLPLGDGFVDTFLKSAKKMFKGAYIEGDLILKGFTFPRLKFAESMFESCHVGGDLILGKNNDLPEDIKTFCMFTGINVNGKQLECAPNYIKMLDRLGHGKSIKQENLEDCMKLFKSEFSRGYSIDGVMKYLIYSGDCKYNQEIVIMAGKKLKEVLSEKCNKELSNLFVIKDGKSASDMSVSQVAIVLENRGYPEDIINKCIVEYLGNQHVSRD